MDGTLTAVPEHRRRSPDDRLQLAAADTTRAIARRLDDIVEQWRWDAALGALRAPLGVARGRARGAASVADLPGRRPASDAEAWVNAELARLRAERQRAAARRSAGPIS